MIALFRGSQAVNKTQDGAFSDLSESIWAGLHRLVGPFYCVEAICGIHLVITDNRMESHTTNVSTNVTLQLHIVLRNMENLQDR